MSGRSCGSCATPCEVLRFLLREDMTSADLIQHPHAVSTRGSSIGSAHSECAYHRLNEKGASVRARNPASIFPIYLMEAFDDERRNRDTRWRGTTHAA
jgi:hypothetical protein